MKIPIQDQAALVLAYMESESADDYKEKQGYTNDAESLTMFLLADEYYRYLVIHHGFTKEQLEEIAAN